MSTNKSSVQFIDVPLVRLEVNEGQLSGLPANPRKISDEKFDLLKKNIEDYPEMLELRALLVYPLDDAKYIIVGGNMRYRAMAELGFTDAPCVVIPKETSVERLQAYTIIDNNGFGQYDWDLLADEWDAAQLTSWGVELPTIPAEINIEDFFDEEPKPKDGSERVVVLIPKELKDSKEQIVNDITDALAGYEGIKIK